MSENKPEADKAAFADVEQLAKRFIELANGMKDEGQSPGAVNGGLMLASCIYATYTAAGNEGYLHDSGVDKVVDLYRKNLAHLQKVKRAARDAGEQ